MPRKLSDLFGRYSLPNVMGRLGHRIGGMFHHSDGNTGITPPGFDNSHYNVDPTGGLTQSGYTPGDYSISNPFTNPNVGGNTSGGYGQMSDPFGGGFLGNMGGHSSGSQWGGTLGGGHALDPSQWGGLFENDAGNSVPYHTQFGGAGESGHGDGRQLLPQWQALAAQHHMGTGGNLPAQGYDSSGINPGGMYTGGNQQAHPMTGMLGRLGGKQPPGGLMR
jgi:hypothetical protein